jgi:AraC-like DNA-binding protein
MSPFDWTYHDRKGFRAMVHPEKRQELRTHIDIPYEDEHILVHFVGDIHCAQYSEIDYHTNPGFEICLIPYGKGLFKIQDQSYAITNDQIFMTKAPQVHAGWPSRDNPYRILYLCFYIKQEGHCSHPFWAEIYHKLNRIEFPVSYDRHKMNDLHYRLFGEILNKSCYSREMLGMLIQQFILLTVRNFEEGLQSPAEMANDRQHRLASRIINYIDEHIAQETSLEQISKALNYSIPSLCRHFKTQTGFTVMEYYNFARLELSKKLLANAGTSVSEISERLNFNSIHHFSNAFKTLYGYSPSTYRKKGG